MSSPGSGPQTDHGRLYVNTPRQILAPRSVEELAATLRGLDARGERVTVRDTGHSTNGQTLTAGVQVSVAELRGLAFDEERLEIRAGAGSSWPDLLTAIRFPRRSPRILPSRPGPATGIGGTAAVGGVGPYSSHAGGLWNHVRSLKLVTMSGEVVDCSPERESDLFRYALAGFGRIGVIGELTLGVEPSRPVVLTIALAYADEDHFAGDFARALADPGLDGVVALEAVTSGERAGGRKPSLRLLVLLAEMDDGHDPQVRADAIRSRYREDIEVFIEAAGRIRGFEPTLRFKTVPKRDLFGDGSSGGAPPGRSRWRRRLGLGSAPEPDVLRPWTDCVVDCSRRPAFLDGLRDLAVRHGVEPFLKGASIAGGGLDADAGVGTLAIKSVGTGATPSFPLAPDLPREGGHACLIAIRPEVPRRLRESALSFSRAATDLAFALGGKRALDGTHELTRAQVEQQYGAGVLETWQRLKDRLDPHHLLNIGVIEHLD